MHSSPIIIPVIVLCTCKVVEQTKRPFVCDDIEVRIFYVFLSQTKAFVT